MGNIQNWIPAIAGVGSILVLLITSLKNKGKYEEKVRRNQKDIEEIRGDVKGIYADIKSIYAKIAEIFASLGDRKSNAIVSQSPTTISNEGMKLAQKVEAERILHTCMERLQSDIEARNPKNPYEVQQYSKEAVFEHFLQYISEEDKNTLETAVYQEGKNIETVLIIVGVMLRDSILSKANYSPA